MSTHDNAPPPEWWVCEPRPDPFDVKAATVTADEHLIRGEN